MPAHRACKAGGGGLECFAGLGILEFYQMHSAPLWIALCSDIAREPFHLEKNGGLRSLEPNLIMCKNLTGNY
jgi:hypothetical protein